MTHANPANNPFYARQISRDATRNEACDRPAIRHKEKNNHMLWPETCHVSSIEGDI